MQAQFTCLAFIRGWLPLHVIDHDDGYGVFLQREFEAQLPVDSLKNREAAGRSGWGRVIPRRR